MRAQLGIHQPDQSRAVQLETGDLAVVADPQLAEAQLTKGGFRRLDLGQPPLGHLGAVRNPGGEAGGGRLVPYGKLSLGGQIADLLLVDTGLEQRGHDAELTSGPHAGPEIGEVVGDRPVSDATQAPAFGQTGQHPEQLGPAVVTTVATVGAVGRIGHFARFHRLVAHSQMARHSAGVFQLVRRQGCRPPGDRQDAIGAERLDRELQQHGAVDPAGQGDQHAIALAQALQCFGSFGFERSGGFHHH